MMIKNDKNLKEHFLREYNNNLTFFAKNNMNVRRYSKIITTTHDICDKLFEILMFEYVFDFNFYINTYSFMSFGREETISFILKFQLNQKINDLLFIEIKYIYNSILMGLNNSDIEINKIEITNISHNKIKEYENNVLFSFTSLDYLDDKIFTDYYNTINMFYNKTLIRNKKLNSINSHKFKNLTDITHYFNKEKLESLANKYLQEKYKDINEFTSHDRKVFLDGANKILEIIKKYK
jgi:hypothetical protein